MDTITTQVVFGAFRPRTAALILRLLQEVRANAIPRTEIFYERYKQIITCKSCL